MHWHISDWLESREQCHINAIINIKVVAGQNARDIAVIVGEDARYYGDSWKRCTIPNPVVFGQNALLH